MRSTSLSNTTPANVELDDLVSLFYADQSTLGRFTQKNTDDCPSEYRAMLAHESHMTVTVERRHACEVDVDVLASRLTDTHYLRKIVLKRSVDHRLVQFGIVRLALASLQANVRDEIMAEQIPLGRVLIRHNVLRKVQLNGLWEVECGPALADLFGVQPGHRTYGRTALIYCDGEPAVELLEIVSPEDTFARTLLE
jgi:chorismate-pyruvate lyase